jgi:hypothetical protein
MYSSGPRNINHVQIVSLGSADDIQYTITNDWYFDQLTGMTVQYSLQFANTTGSYSGSGKYETKLTESNAWTIPEFPLYLMPPLFILMTLLTVTVYRRRRSLQRPAFLKKEQKARLFQETDQKAKIEAKEFKEQALSSILGYLPSQYNEPSDFSVESFGKKGFNSAGRD